MIPARRTSRLAGSRIALGVAMLAACGFVWFACREGGEASERPVAPASQRAALVIEPPELRVGDTATVELAIVTPPGHRVAPVAPPDRVGGLWVLATESPQTDRSDTRWVHRLRFEVRARATGRFVWPAQSVAVEAPDGSVESVEVPARPYEVVDVLSEHPEQRSFFSLRSAPPVGHPTGSLGSAVLGALGALALVGLVLVVRSARDRRRRATGPGGAAPPWQRTQTALAAAGALACEDPLRAASLASAALRLHVERHFGEPARARTTEELDECEPDAVDPDLWSRVLVLLRELDAVRYVVPESGRDSERRVTQAIESAQVVVLETLPPSIRGRLEHTSADGEVA